MLIFRFFFLHEYSIEMCVPAAAVFFFFFFCVDCTFCACCVCIKSLEPTNVSWHILHLLSVESQVALQTALLYVFVNKQFSLGIEPVYECSKILDEKAAKEILFIQISYT